MDSREAIIQAAIQLIGEKGERMEEITVREICARAQVGLGLVNYHFGSKEALLDLCVERMVNGVVAHFAAVREKTEGLPPFEKLEFLGNMTFGFLFAHEALARISVLSDLKQPDGDDNTHRTYRAYLPLVAACRPDWPEEVVREKTFFLITVMQQAFLRHRQIKETLGTDLNIEAERNAFHRKVLSALLGRGTE